MNDVNELVEKIMVTIKKCFESVPYAWQDVSRENLVKEIRTLLQSFRGSEEELKLLNEVISLAEFEKQNCLGKDVSWYVEIIIEEEEMELLKSIRKKLSGESQNKGEKK